MTITSTHRPLRTRRAWIWTALGLAVLAGTGVVGADDDPSPPTAPVKLVFIHHSTGGNWLGDVDEWEQFDGGLGQALMENNYFVSATNYGWSVDGDAIGDRTDIGHWWDWFRGPNRDQVMQALVDESGQNIGSFLPWSRLEEDPGGENEVILFKSCFPNSHISGSPDDPPTTGDNPIRGVGSDLGWGGSNYTVGNCKGIYNDILEYFATRTDKLFVLITPPPIAPDDMYHSDEHTAAHAANARALNNWLVNDWLDDYPHANVAVFDFYNVLTSNGGDVFVSDEDAASGNHHRWTGSSIEHLQTVDNNFSSYGAYMDSHPTDAGGQKATAELLPLLNIFYNRFKNGGAGGDPPTAEFGFTPVAPQPGQPVSFFDQSTGNATSWLWDFGDGTDTSSDRNPTHTFVTPGSYAVSLTVSNAYGSDSVTHQVIVQVATLYRYLFGGVAHAPGAADTQWRTDIAGVNLTQLAANLVMTFYSNAAPISRSVSLDPGQTVRWDDVLVSVFGVNASSSVGSVEVDSDQPLYLTSRTYNQSPDGTFGQYLPACTSADAMGNGVLGVLPHLEKSPAFRSNIGVVNLGDAVCTVVIRLYDASGIEVGDSTAQTVNPSRWAQVNDIFSSCGAGPQDVAYATVEVSTPGGRIWAYASVVDMESGDPTTIPLLVQ